MISFIELSSRTDDEILRGISVSCCENRCMRSLSVEDLFQMECSLKVKSQSEKRNYVLSFLHVHSKVNESGEYETDFIIRGKPVCQKARVTAHDMTKDTFWPLYNLFKNGVTVVEHGIKGRNSLMQTTKECIAWLEFFVHPIGDHQPDRKVIHLPSCFSRLDVFKKMQEENTQFRQPSVSMTHFYRLWDKHFSHVLIPKEGYSQSSI